MNDDIKVSILCVAYNHEKYIRKALEGFVMQKTDFAYEILIHDDASTDHTADIIREFEIQYPRLIKPIYQTENQYSKKVGIVKTFLWPRVKGKYVAFCEGDDYWTDPLKLQKQYDAMETHPDINMCAHAAIMINAVTGKKISDIRPKSLNTILSVEDVIFGGGGYVATNSLFYRFKITKNQPEFRKILSFDYTLQILGSLHRGMLYLDECMSVYNLGVDGSWSTRMGKNKEKLHEHYKKMQDMLDVLDLETDHAYQEVIKKRKLKNEYELLNIDNKCKDLLEDKYREIYREQSLKERVKIRIKAAFPRLLEIKRREQRIK